MTRLIDAEIAYDKIAEQETSYYMDMEGVQAGLDETPTVDAVQVVRCGECRWWREIDSVDGTTFGECMRPHSINQEGWFCADGERKTE